MNIKEFVDLHVHIGPEPIPRKFYLQGLIDTERDKIAGFALKNHFYSTVPFIKSASIPEGLAMVGSVVLNNYVGGLNAEAVRLASEMLQSPIMVWFPTINAQNFLEKSEYEIRPEWIPRTSAPRLSRHVNGITVIDGKGMINDAAKAVLREILDHGCALATGHLSWQESKILVSEALAMGIGKIIITHPIYQLIDMPIDVQKELAAENGVFIEEAYSMYSIDGIDMEAIAAQIKEIGPDKCIMSSDMGQVSSPNPSSALADFAGLLKKCGISEEELLKMGKTNPGYIIR